MPIVWDEGDALDRADAVRDWLAAFPHLDRLPRPLSAEGIRRGWPFTTEREGHPAFYGLVIALGRELAPNFLDPLTRYRFGPMLLFAVACGTAGARVARSWGMLAAAAAVLGILLQPRLFAHAHFASFDGPLTGCWLLTWATLPLHQRPLGRGATTSVRGSALRLVLCGAALGLTMACKASGLLAVFPVLVALLLIFGRRGLLAIPIVMATASAVFWTANPPIWLHPVEGLGRFLYLNLNRAEQPGLNISTWFAGRMYNLDFPLPWYNTLLWTAIAVPLPILCFFLIGLIFVLGSRSHRRSGLILGTFWVTLVVARAIPGTPPHDGIRQFLPSFGILGIVAGIGAFSAYRLLRLEITRRVRERLSWVGLTIPLFNTLRRRGRPAAATPPRRRHFDRSISAAGTFPKSRPAFGILQLALALFYLSPLYSLVIYGPQWLSFYNCLIGGVGGASRVGFEATYYWDALDDEVMRWLRDHTSDGEAVFLATYPRANLRRLQAWNRIDWEPAPHPAQADWYVVQNRPSGWSAIDRRLYAEGAASFEKRVGRLGPASPVLLKVFSRQEYGRLRQATQQP
ncbi:MAG: ArnT family glycosyltransferase [Thermogutta sp.]